MRGFFVGRSPGGCCVAALCPRDRIAALSRPSSLSVLSSPPLCPVLCLPRSVCALLVSLYWGGSEEGESLNTATDCTGGDLVMFGLPSLVPSLSSLCAFFLFMCIFLLSLYSPPCTLLLSSSTLPLKPALPLCFRSTPFYRPLPFCLPVPCLRGRFGLMLSYTPDF